MSFGNVRNEALSVIDICAICVYSFAFIGLRKHKSFLNGEYIADHRIILICHIQILSETSYKVFGTDIRTIGKRFNFAVCVYVRKVSLVSRSVHTVSSRIGNGYFELNGRSAPAFVITDCRYGNFGNRRFGQLLDERSSVINEHGVLAEITSAVFKSGFKTNRIARSGNDILISADCDLRSAAFYRHTGYYRAVGSGYYHVVFHSDTSPI